MIKTPIISVFMPVYNGEKYLKKSIESVLNQTFKEFEFIIVDDSSTDNSYSIIKEYAEIDYRIRIFQKPNGGNVPKSWNFAMPYLKGEFISYMSQDDWMSEDNLELNYKRYLETGAEIIVPDLIYYSENGNIELSGIKGNHEQIISGKEAFILSLFWEVHGFTLCKANIMKSEPFDENSYNSDEYITRKNFLLSNNVAFSKGLFYYFQDNLNSMTKNFKLYHIEWLLTDQKLLKLMDNHNIEIRVISTYEFSSFFAMVNFYSKIINHKNNGIALESTKEYKKIIIDHNNFLRKRNFTKKLPKIKRAIYSILMLNVTTLKLFALYFLIKHSMKVFLKNLSNNRLIKPIKD